MKILVADDHQFIVDDLIDELRELVPEAECTGTNDPSGIMELFEKINPDIVFMDIEMPGANGIGLARKMLEIKPRTNIIYITGYSKYALESYSTYASAFLEKPINTDMIRDALEHLRFPVSSITVDMIEASHSGSAVIGKKIERLREERGMTRQTFAAEMKVSLQTVYRWENGERIPDVLTFLKIAKVLGTTPDKLML